MEKEEKANQFIIISRRLNEDERRIRYLEQRVERISNSLSKIEETIASSLNNLKVNQELLSTKISDLREKFETLKENVLKLSEKMEKFAKKSDLKKIETFIDLINPITSKFVTRNELEREIRILKEKA